jgi:Calcineurin-like phosphoesterase
MSLLVTADLHLSSNARDDYRFKAMEYLADLILKYKPERLIILGDLTEEKNYHSATLANDVVDLIFYLSCMVLVDILCGNHDYTDPTCPYFFFVRHMKNVRWINQPRLSQVGADIHALYLPHTQNYQRDWVGAVMGEQNWRDINWVFAHNTFEGASTEHGHRLHGIPTTIFPEGVEVVSGDVHTPQKIDCVTYVGSPYTVDFGDEFEPRVLLLTEDKMKSIPMIGPQKRLVELDSNVNTITKLSTFGLHEGDIVKARYQLAADEREEWAEIKKQVREKLTELGCVPFLIQPVLEKSAKKKITKSKHRVISDEVLVRNFGEQAKVATPTVETGLDLLEKA